MENHSICDTVAPSSLTDGCLHRVKPPKTMADLSSFGLDVVDELSSAIEESFGIANCERDERKQGLYTFWFRLCAVSFIGPSLSRLFFGSILLFIWDIRPIS